METRSIKKEDKQNSEIIPQKLWQRIGIVAVVMILAYFTSFLVKPAAALLNVDLKDFDGFTFKITFGTMVLTLGYALSQFLLIYLVNRFVHKRSFRSLGFRRPVFKPMIIGIFIGSLFTGIYYIIRALIGGNFSIAWAVPAEVPVLSLIFHAFFVLIFILTINSLKEELVFRVYPLEQFMDKPKAMIIILVLISLFFSGIHFMYKSSSLEAFIYRFNIALLFGFAYYHWRSIWFISGIHTGSNIMPFLFFSGRWQVGGLWTVSFSGMSDMLRIIIFTVLTIITMLIMYQFRPRRKSEESVVQ